MPRISGREQLRRLLSIYLFLQKHPGYITIPELAERFKVNDRTIHRDVTILANGFGVEIVGSRRRGKVRSMIVHFGSSAFAADLLPFPKSAVLASRR